MAVEIAMMRIAKIRNNLIYSRKGLNNKLGLIKEKSGDESTTNEIISWLNIR